MAPLLRSRRTGLLSLVLVQGFPQLLAVVAIFLLLTRIGDIFPGVGLDTHAGLIRVYLGGALGINTYLMYGYFSTVPVEIDEAAKIDGAGHARVFFSIILHLVAPILAVGLYRMVANPSYADWSAFAAGAVMSSVPVVILFLYLQKYIVSGLTAGSFK